MWGITFFSLGGRTFPGAHRFPEPIYRQQNANDGQCGGSKGQRRNPFPPEHHMLGHLPQFLSELFR